MNEKRQSVDARSEDTSTIQRRADVRCSLLNASRLTSPSCDLHAQLLDIAQHKLQVLLMHSSHAATALYMFLVVLAKPCIDVLRRQDLFLGLICLAYLRHQQARKIAFQWLVPHQ